MSEIPRTRTHHPRVCPRNQGGVVPERGRPDESTSYSSRRKRRWFDGWTRSSAFLVLLGSRPREGSVVVGHATFLESSSSSSSCPLPVVARRMAFAPVAPGPLSPTTTATTVTPPSTPSFSLSSSSAVAFPIARWPRMIANHVVIRLRAPTRWSMLRESAAGPSDDRHSSSPAATTDPVTTTESTWSHRLRQQLEQCAIPDLRAMVKATVLGQQRGVVSRLKRKADYVDFLLSQHDLLSLLEAPVLEEQRVEPMNIDGVVEELGLVSSRLESSRPPDPPSTFVVEGATLPSATVSMAVNDDIRPRTTVQSTKARSLSMPALRRPASVSLSPSSTTPSTNLKDLVFDKVYQRYPPTWEWGPLMSRTHMPESSSPAIAEMEPDSSSLVSSQLVSLLAASGLRLASADPVLDVRQRYHPIFNTPLPDVSLTEPMDGNHTSDEETNTHVTQPRTRDGSRSVKSHPVTSSDMDLVFLGTASCTPSTTRGVSCTALRLNWRRRQHVGDNPFQGGTWLFDVGECTQLQIQRTSVVKPSKITKIFLTHAHGDHSFGLPGLLCLMGQDRDRDDKDISPIDIYGPEGLRMWLRVAIRYSISRIVPPYRVHELKNIPMAPEWEFNARSRRYYYRGLDPRLKAKDAWKEQGLAGEDPVNWISQAHRMPIEASSLYGEVDGGRDIYPIYGHKFSADGGAPVWDVEVDEDSDVHVYAAPMSHGVPCVGYVVKELPRPGRLRNEYVEPIVRRNVDALKQAGFDVPMKAMSVIKNLQPGTSFTFPDGTVVQQEDAVEAPRVGRKVVICGDTCSSRALAKLAHEADVVVHEATNTFLAGVDRPDLNLRSVQREATIHGHSTPHIAGAFAKQVQARQLVLNHFSARYKGDVSVESLSFMMRIEEQAMQASGLNETQVVAAWDLMTLPIPSH